MSNVTKTKTPKLKSLSTISTTPATWELVNNTGTALVVIDAFSSGTSSDAQLYQQSLLTLSTTDGQKQVAAGKTKTISLGEAHKDTNGTTLDYTIILATADSLFPVKVVTVTASSASQTVTSADADNMKLAEKFKKYVDAFPNSAIAKDFGVVLESRDPAKATDFFAKYTDYASLDLQMIVAVETYYHVFPFAWANYSASKKYQVYTSDGTTNKLAGIVTLSNACALPLTADKSVPGFTITCMVGSVIKPLVYLNGQFTDDAGGPGPLICLQGVFILKSQLTTVSTDNEIIAVLSGTVNNQQVMAHDDGPGSGSSTTLDKLLPPKTLAGWVKFCCILVGGIILTLLLAKLMKMAVDAYRNRGAMTQAEYDKMQEDFRKKQAEDMKTDQEYLDRLKQSEAPKLPDSFQDFSDFAHEQVLSMTYEADIQHISDISTHQSRICKTALSYGKNTNLEKVSTSLKETKDWLKTNPDPAAVAKKLNDTMTDFKSNSELMAKEWVKIKNKQSADMLTVDEAQRAIDDITSKVQENEKIRDDWRDENMPEDIIMEH